MSGTELVSSLASRLLGAAWTTVRARKREIERERPEVLLKIRFRNPGSEWRSANFSVTNLPSQQLVAKRIELGVWPWGSGQVRISPAKIDGKDWLRDETVIGRTLILDHILRGTAPRQNVPFFLHDPRELVDGGRHWLKIRILLEHRTDASRWWWAPFRFPLPQEPGDDILFNMRGPHR
ncbi:hypothetical protein ABIE89_007535 [Bradyrhizobium niftali]|uniref:hypothetical protein n=1 Tax=Bradyrhizobium niftali TaxID=2560055 RepID=UPI0038334677